MSPTSRIWWRIDHEPHDRWDWVGFVSPRHRFDPPSGRFRVRYAANDPIAAARERFPARRIAPGAISLQLVQLEDPPSALHLTHQRNLDAFEVDDRINTGRLDTPLAAGGDPLLDVCQQLSDAVHDWWDGAPPPLVCRTRRVSVARSMAFTESATWGSVRSRPLREATALLVELVTHHGFDVPGAWL